MVQIRIESDEQSKLENIIIGQVLSIDVKIFDSDELNSEYHSAKLKLYGDTYLTDFLKNKNYDSAVSFIEKSMKLREKDLYNYKAHKSSIKEPLRIREEGIRKKDIQREFIETVKKGSKALFTIGYETGNPQYTARGIDILNRYETAKKDTKGEGKINFTANLGKFGYDTLLPLALNKELVGFVFREYMSITGLEGTMNMFRRTPSEKIADDYMKTYSQRRKVA